MSNRKCCGQFQQPRQHGQLGDVAGRVFPPTGKFASGGAVFLRFRAGGDIGDQCLGLANVIHHGIEQQRFSGSRNVVILSGRRVLILGKGYVLRSYGAIVFRRRRVVIGGLLSPH